MANNKNKTPKNRERKMTRREILAASSMTLLAAQTTAWGQGGGRGGPPPAPAAPPSTIPDTEWHTFGNDPLSNRYVPIDQINASNFNKLEMVWRFGTQNLGPRWDADFQSTPVIAKGRLI